MNQETIETIQLILTAIGAIAFMYIWYKMISTPIEDASKEQYICNHCGKETSSVLLYHDAVICLECYDKFNIV